MPRLDTAFRYTVRCPASSTRRSVSMREFELEFENLDLHMFLGLEREYITRQTVRELKKHAILLLRNVLIQIL